MARTEVWPKETIIMALKANDLILGRAARYIIAHPSKSGAVRAEELASKLLSCLIVNTSFSEEADFDSDEDSDENDSNYQYAAYTVSIRGPRDIYELLWEIGDAYRNMKRVSRAGGFNEAARHLYQAFLHTAPSSGYGFPVRVIFVPDYGAAGRDAATQTELYMYVFGDDPVGQQVQVLDTGPHSAPTRQLIVSPVPVLPVSEVKRDDRLCFVVMPFAQQFRPVYDYAIAPAVTAAGLTCRRGDDISQPGAILTQIWQSILQARLVVADLSGANGNVLYELGLAHVLGHEAILLAQNIADVPFDLRHQRTIVYAMTREGVEALRTSLMAAIQTSLAGSRR